MTELADKGMSIRRRVLGEAHVARAEEWPIMPTEWVHTLLKPWNFFDETPTLGKKKEQK